MYAVVLKDINYLVRRLFKSVYKEVTVYSHFYINQPSTLNMAIQCLISWQFYIEWKKKEKKNEKNPPKNKKHQQQNKQTNKNQYMYFLFWAPVSYSHLNLNTSKQISYFNKLRNWNLTIITAGWWTECVNV